MKRSFLTQDIGARGKRGHGPDLLILFCVGFLILFGLVMLSSASSQLGQRDFGDSYYYLKHQLLYGISLGLLGFLLTYRMYYGVYRNRIVSMLFILVAILCMLAVFTPLGYTAKGATRWLNLGGFSFQPGELLKIALIIYLAAWLSKGHRSKEFKSGYLPFFIVLGVVSLLLVFQHSTSPVAILVTVALIMYFISGAKWRYIFGTLLVGLAGLSILVFFSPYRADRIFTYLNPEADPRGSGFHILQAKTAIGSGGMFGVGYGQSVVKARLPEPIGDSIFAVIAEEFGFVGTMVLLSAFGILILRIFLLARRFRDQFGQLLLVGFGSVIALQAFINIGAMTGLLPLTGTPLPFLSYGGTALAVFMTMTGIILNISKYT